MARIYKYQAYLRPSYVDDGGYVYDGEWCLGFGNESGQYEISIEAAVEFYNSVVSSAEQTDEFGNTVTPQTAEEFLKDHNASSSDLAIQLLTDTDAKTIRVIEDLIETLVSKSVINLEDLPLEAQNKLIVRQNLRELI